MKFKKRRKHSSRAFNIAKVCRFCTEKINSVDYKDVKTLRSMISEKGKITPRRISGNCARHQRQVTTAVNRARNIALIPFVA